MIIIKSNLFRLLFIFKRIIYTSIYNNENDFLTMYDMYVKIYYVIMNCF